MKIPFISLLQRIFLRELVQTFLLCVVCLLALVLISRGLQMRNLFLGLDLEILDVVSLFIYMMPTFMTLILPISCMLSVFLTCLRMSTDRELTALKAGGISLYQMLTSPFIFSFACTLVSLFISLYGISWGVQNFRSTILEIANTRAKVMIQPGVVNPNFSGLTLFARQVDANTGELKEIIFEDRTKGEGTNITILAPSGSLINDNEKGELVFNLSDGRIYHVEGNQFSILSFENYAVHMDISEVLSGLTLPKLRPKDMGMQDLEDILADRVPHNDKEYYRAHLEVHKRWSLPVACLVLGLFAFPLACSLEGLRRQIGIVFSMIFFLMYYGVFSIGLALGEQGKLPPLIGLWFPNVLFALFTASGLYLVVKERVPSLNSITMFRRLRRKKLRQRELSESGLEININTGGGKK